MRDNWGAIIEFLKSPLMDNYQFNLTPQNEWAQYTWEHGTLLMARNWKDFSIKPGSCIRIRDESINHKERGTYAKEA